MTKERQMERNRRMVEREGGDRERERERARGGQWSC